METVTNKFDEINNNVEGNYSEGKSEVEGKGSDSVYTDHKEMCVTVTKAEEWLCVAKLPLDTTNKELEKILEEFGKVDQCFIMKSKTTGQSKGYGFARFCSTVSGVQARHVLEGQELRGHNLNCGWLEVGTHALDRLHSKVLLVDKLPPGYKDMGQLRNLFSRIVSPPYCQIAMKCGVIQDWGLVEFNNAFDAEATLDAMNNFNLNGHRMRIQYYIPGIHAINIYMSFINNPMDSRTEKKALLEDIPNRDVYQQLEALSKQNPWFVKSLQSIMTQTIIAEDTSRMSSPHASLEAVAGITLNGPLMASINGQQTKAQALILLLAQELQNQYSQHQLGGSSSVAELLKTVLVPQQHLVSPPPQPHLVLPLTHHHLVRPPSQQHLVALQPHLFPPPGYTPTFSQVDTNSLSTRTTLLATPPIPQTPPTLLSPLPATPPTSPTPPIPLPSPPINNKLSHSNQTHQLTTLISNMTDLVGAEAIPAKPRPKVTPHTKNPQLMNMLYSAFQARMLKTQQTQKVKEEGSETQKKLPGAVPSNVQNISKLHPTFSVNNNNQLPKPVPSPLNNQTDIQYPVLSQAYNGTANVVSASSQSMHQYNSVTAQYSLVTTKLPQHPSVTPQNNPSAPLYTFPVMTSTNAQNHLTATSLPVLYSGPPLPSQQLSGRKNLSEILSMPPPPPPPLYTSPEVGRNWEIPSPETLLFSPVISSIPPLWPPQPPPLIIPPPNSCVPPFTPVPPDLASPKNMKRKPNEIYGQVATFPDTENHTLKRQKLIGDN